VLICGWRLDPHRATPPWCEHVPERCWLYEGVPSRHIAVCAEAARVLNAVAIGITRRRKSLRIMRTFIKGEVATKIRRNAESDQQNGFRTSQLA
jgi:hypothetical protein